RYIFAYFVLLTVMTPSASALPEIRIETLQHELLRAPVEFLVTETQLDLEQAGSHTFRPLERAEINQGVSDDHFWLRLALSNNGDQPRSWVIFNDSTYLDNFQVHYRDVRPGTNEG